MTKLPGAPGRGRLTVLALALGASVSACSAGDDGSAAQDGTVDVLASFYPLQYVVQQVGGEYVSVSPVTPPGVDPHALELAPADVAQLDQAGLVVYLSGFQAAMDDAVAATSPGHVLDVAEFAGEGHPHGEAEQHESDDQHAEGEQDQHAEGEHQDERAGGDHDHNHDLDPHFWLDPMRLAEVATAVADELSEVAPEHAEDFAGNAERLTGELVALDQEYRTALSTCQDRTIVVAHEAYGFLAERYDLEQVGISGLEPESEPSPARLAEISDVVREQDVTTIFTESLLDPTVTQTLADDLGVGTALLDPVESQLDEDADYQDVMQANLTALTEALRCD